jgi:hypothetical protein
MAFATLTSGTATSILSSGAYGDSGTIQKVAELITFPNIEGRDAPGKTGNAAKPALIVGVGLTIGVDSPGIKTRNCVWDSTGVNPRFSAEVTPGSSIQSLIRSVFSGTQYWIGVSSVDGVSSFGIPTSRFSYGIISGATGARFSGVVWQDAFPNSRGFADSGSAGSGRLAYRVEYNVLPTAPLNLASTLVTPSNPAVQLDWDEVSSDGGSTVSGYRIQSSTDNITWSTLVANTGSTSRTYTTSELVFGTTYYFRIAAINQVAIAAGSDYSGPYSSTATATIAGAVAGNAQSLLTATVDNPDPEPLAFTDFGPGIRFTQIDVQYGAEYLYNEIQASTQDSFAELQTTEAPQSKALYGVRTYSITNLLNSTDLGAFEVAKDYLTYYYQPELRVQSITVDLSNLTIQEKLQVLALEIDSFISVSFTPNGVGDPKIASGLVTGIAHRISITTHEVELRLRNERNLFTLDSDSKGILDVNILGP